MLNPRSRRCTNGRKHSGRNWRSIYHLRDGRRRKVKKLACWENLAMALSVLEKQCWRNLEMVRQFADVALAQLAMPVDDQGRQGTIAQQPAQVRLSHATFFHQILQHGHRAARFRGK